MLRYLEALELVRRWETQLAHEIPNSNVLEGSLLGIGTTAEQEERRQHWNIYRERVFISLSLSSSSHFQKRLWEVELNHCVDFVSAGFNAVFTFPGGFLIDVEDDTLGPRPSSFELLSQLQRQVCS